MGEDPNIKNFYFNFNDLQKNEFIGDIGKPDFKFYYTCNNDSTHSFHLFSLKTQQEALEKPDNNFFSVKFTIENDDNVKSSWGFITPSHPVVVTFLPTEINTSSSNLELHAKVEKKANDPFYYIIPNEFQTISFPEFTDVIRAFGIIYVLFKPREQFIIEEVVQAFEQYFKDPLSIQSNDLMCAIISDREQQTEEILPLLVTGFFDEKKNLNYVQELIKHLIKRSNKFEYEFIRDKKIHLIKYSNHDYNEYNDFVDFKEYKDLDLEDNKSKSLIFKINDGSNIAFDFQLFDEINNYDKLPILELKPGATLELTLDDVEINKKNQRIISLKNINSDDLKPDYKSIIELDQIQRQIIFFESNSYQPLIFCKPIQFPLKYYQTSPKEDISKKIAIFLSVPKNIANSFAKDPNELYIVTVFNIRKVTISLVKNLSEEHCKFYDQSEKQYTKISSLKQNHQNNQSYRNCIISFYTIENDNTIGNDNTIKKGIIKPFCFPLFLKVENLTQETIKDYLKQEKILKIFKNFQMEISEQGTLETSEPPVEFSLYTVLLSKSSSINPKKPLKTPKKPKKPKK